MTGTVSLLQKIARHLPAEWRARLIWWRAQWRARGAPPGAPDARTQAEIAHFSDYEEINDLPPIFTYWANAHLLPLAQAMGFTHPEDFFCQQIMAQHARIGRAPRIVSLGCGNCDNEVRIAQMLIERRLDAFTIECLDITAPMLERGRKLVHDNGLAAHFAFVEADFNRWAPKGHYDVVLANQCLHHVSNLEHLFAAIGQAIGADGVFITSDIIGRNGHQRWPEAGRILDEFWQELPAEYRYNRALNRQETSYLDWDCSVAGFEGIRAQDILPLMREHFGFRFFFPFGNVITPFVDRAFGHHFDAARVWDREFIDRVHARDEAEMLAGTIKPTNLIAALCNDRRVIPQVRAHLTPEFCERPP
jgi:SAM-dependent methyltransferase